MYVLRGAAWNCISHMYFKAQATLFDVIMSFEVSFWHFAELKAWLYLNTCNKQSDKTECLKETTTYFETAMFIVFCNFVYFY